MKKDFYSSITKYSLYLLAFLLPLQTRLFIKNGEINEGYSEYLTISIYLTDFLLIFILSTALILRKAYTDKSEDKQALKWLWLIVLGLDLSIFLSIIFAGDKIVAIYKYLLILMGFGLFWLLLEIKYNYQKMLAFFLSGAWLQSLIAIWQFINQKTFSSKFLGISGHDITEPGTSVVEAMGNIGLWERWLRAYGGLDHPNILGGFMVVSIIICLYLMLKINPQNFKEKLYKISLYVFIGSFFTAVFFSFSRSAWISLWVSLIIIFLFFLIKKEWEYFINFLKPFLLGLFIFIVLFFTYNNIAMVRINGNGALEANSNLERMSQMIYSKKLIADNKAFGSGIGNYSFALSQKIEGKPSWFYQPVHNAYLLLISEIGIIGGFFAGLFLLFIFIKSISSAMADSKKIINFSLLISILILMLFDHWLWSLHFGILLLFFVFAFTLYPSKK